MKQDSYTKLSREATAQMLEIVNPQLEGIRFEAPSTVILAQDLEFYPGHQLLEIADHASSPPLKINAVEKDGAVTFLDWTNGPVYRLNEKAPIRLTAGNAAAYVHFFFTHVRGRHGRFLIVETVDDIPWREEPPNAARKAIGQMVRMLEVEKTNDAGEYVIPASIVFKDSLFHGTVLVHPSGAVRLENETLAIEDMPMLDEAAG